MVTPQPRDGYDPDEEAPTGPSMTFQWADEITPTRPEWLWCPWLCVGALHLLVGRQGGGKTTFASWVIGLLSTGRCFPGVLMDGDPVKCALLSLEEPADRLVARLHATGADVTKVVILGDVQDFDADGRSIQRPWRLPKDSDALETVLSREAIAVLMIDGLGYSVAGDSHNYAVIGSALSALGGVAERTGCAILGLTHPPKGGSDPVTAAIGSTAWTAVARVVWVLGTDPDDDSGATRVVRVSKSNFKMPDDALAFTIGDDQEYECGYVTGVTASSVTAEDLTAAAIPAAERTERDEAREIVRSILRPGRMEVAEFQKSTDAAGLSARTVTRARRDLGVKSTAWHDPDTGKVTRWMVELPTHTATTAQASLNGAVGAVGAVVPNSNNKQREIPRVSTVPSEPTAAPSPPAEALCATCGAPPEQLSTFGVIGGCEHQRAG
jgi:AAA domain-containing protein